MRMVITEFVLNGTCELTGRRNVECVVVSEEGQMQEASIGLASLTKFVRFRFKHRQKTNSPEKPGVGSKSASGT